MTTKIVFRRILAAGLAMVAWTSVTATSADAQARRDGRWQFTIPINFTFSQSIDGQGGTTVDLSNDVGWGFTFGYNMNERFMLGLETTWLRANYDAEVVTDENGDGNPDGTVNVGGALDAFTMQGVGQFNILEGTLLTPFVRGNLGFSYTDSNIASGPPQGGCWWDPWWGYVCGSWRPTYDQTSFSFGAGAGVRADISRTFFLELSANGLWIDFENDTPVFGGIRLNIGWLF
jgi:opacity protein-like surface antigen